MARGATRRTQAERTEATTAALLDAARELFTRDGYDTTSLDAVAARAGVTKGAVYHHFDGKRQLFEAVFSREIEQLTTPLATAYSRRKDPWDAFKAASVAFLDECLDPGLQRIVLVDAPAAIGWEGIRRLEAPVLDLMEAAILRAIDAGRIATRPPSPLAHFLFGAICEVAMIVARAEDQKTAQRQAVTEIGRVLDSLAIA